eukprot:6490926-Amphidinium_carterae.2
MQHFHFKAGFGNLRASRSCLGSGSAVSGAVSGLSRKWLGRLGPSRLLSRNCLRVCLGIDFAKMGLVYEILGH